MSLNCRGDAQRDIFAVTVSLESELGLDADTGPSLCLDLIFDLDILRVLEGKKRHEVGMMDYKSLSGALHQIAFSGVSGDDVADCVGHAAFERERDPSKGMTQSFSALALAALGVGTDFIFQ